MSRDPKVHRLDAWDTLVWAAATPKELRRVGKLDGPKRLTDEGYAGRTFNVVTGGAHHVVVYVDVRQHPTRVGLINTCAHEASHLADAIFEHVEEDRPGCETRAYLVGWATAWLLTHCDPSLAI